MYTLLRRAFLLTLGVLSILAMSPEKVHAQRMRMGAMMPRQSPRPLPGFTPGFAMMHQPGFSMMPQFTPGFAMMNRPSFPMMPAFGSIMPPVSPMMAGTNPYRNAAMMAGVSPYGSGAGGYGGGGAGGGGYGGGSAGGMSSNAPYGGYGNSAAVYGSSASPYAGLAGQASAPKSDGRLMDILGIPHDGNKMSWPLGLRVLSPAAKAGALREQVDSLIHFAATQAVGGSVDVGTVSAATHATAQLRELLKKGGSAPMAVQTDRDAHRFLDRLDTAFLSLPN